MKPLSILAIFTAALTSASASSLLPRIDSTFYIRLGAKRRNVGTLVGQPLYDAIYRKISQFCYYNKEENKVTCINDAAKAATGVEGPYGEKDDLMIFLESANFPNGYPGIENLLYEQVAGTFKVMSEDQSNCYDEDGKRLCNVGYFVGVREAKTGAHLDVTVRWGVRSLKGKFNCKAAKTAATKFFDENVRGNLMKVVKSADMGSHANCEERPV